MELGAALADFGASAALIILDMSRPVAGLVRLDPHCESNAMSAARQSSEIPELTTRPADA